MAQDAKGPKDTENSTGLKKKVNLPFYDDYKSRQEAPAVKSPGVVSTTVESYVRSVRLQCSGVTQTIKNFNDTVTHKYDTAKAHTLSVVDYFQSEPELWQRCGIVATAGLVGLISAYRRTPIVKTRNVLVGSGIATVICWPQQTVDAVSWGYNSVAERVPPVHWPRRVAETASSEGKGYSYDKEPVVTVTTDYSKITPAATTNVVFPGSKLVAEEDQGQSEAEDQDMYSTRGS
ncbi:uncharacterized protein [Watersipora subatra]|uniref:uncharacterized protein n=1 Tax=Watersipora subatra TaxID=2589382 RepID=UPI00355BDEDC